MTPAGIRQSLREAIADGLEALDTGDAARESDDYDAAADRLAAFVEGLAHWNRVYNLTAVRAPGAMVTHHVLDSLAVLPWFRGMATVLDVGSGAGLPGIPLAVMLPGTRFTLLDSSGKRTRFIRQMQAELALENVEIVTARVEDYARSAGRCFACVTSRAFASLADFVRGAGGLCAPDGRLLALKGVYPEDELRSLPPGFAVEAVTAVDVPGLDAERHIVYLRPNPVD